MPTPPTGTVTFLFTDIEGSTTRWEHHRAAMRAALDRHNALVSAAIDAHGGFVFKTVGDAFCAAFGDPAAAVQAAIDAQRALAAENWARFGEDFPYLRVRMALHTGAAEHQDGDYLGPPLNRVARLLATAHGGQVLVSLATQQLVRDQLPDGAALVDLGVHRLKDLKRTEHLFRVVAAGFPDIATQPDTAEQVPAGANTHIEADALPAECPYRGLLAFRENDAPFFFGRETFTALLEESVAAAPMVGVIGPSGSGKSSVVFAGLVPRLRASNGAGRGAWTVVEMRPGSRPHHALAAALAPLVIGAEASAIDRIAEINKLAAYLRDGSVAPRDVLARIDGNRTGGNRSDGSPSKQAGSRSEPARLLLVVDQFEELYTLCPDDAEQRAFQDLLFAAAFETSANGGNRVMSFTLALTLRADFMGHALAYRPFADAIQKHDVKLGPMTRDELARAVRMPAEKQGRGFETGLVERIVDDVGEKPGSLPLLEFALTKLWEKQEAGWLTHEAYESIGRVEGAVARHADAVYQPLGEAEQERVRRVFVQLVQPGEGTEDTRRLATHEELGADWPLVQKLADARLVVTGRDEAGREVAEVVHEALIRSWQQLREWMSADRRFRTWQERLRFAVRQWKEASEDEGALLRGVPLAEAEGWLAERGGELAPAERAFVEASVAQQARHVAEEQARVAREREQQVRTLSLERRSHRLVRVVAGVAVVGAIVAGALAWNATRSNERAQRLRMVAQSQKLLADGQPDTALSLAAEALDGAGDLPEAEAALSEAAYAPGARWVISTTATVNRLAVSPDGRTILTADADRSLRLRDAGSGKLLRTLSRPGGQPGSIAWLPDGRRAITGEADGSVVLWDTEAGVVLATLAGHVGVVSAVAVSLDGTRALSAGYDHTVRVWDLATRQVLHVLTGHGSLVLTVAISPDGRLGASSDNGQPDAIVWDLFAGVKLRRLSGQRDGLVSLAFSPDSRRVAGIGNDDSSVRVWDVATGRVELTTEPSSFDGCCVAFSPDGATVAAADLGAAHIALWGVPGGSKVSQYGGVSDGLNAIAFSPDGTHLYAATRDAKLAAWDTHSGAELYRRTFADEDPFFPRLQSSWLQADGRSMLSLFFDGTASIADLATGEEKVVLSGLSPMPSAAARSPDGNRIAVSTADGGVEVWDLREQRRIWRTHRHNQSWNNSIYLSFSPDGTVVVSRNDTTTDESIRFWDASNGDFLWRIPADGQAWDARFAPDGRHVAVVEWPLVDRSYPASIQVWDVKSRRQLWRADLGTGQIWSPVLSPTGCCVATGGFDRRVEVRDLLTGRSIERIDLDAAVLRVGLGYSADGRYLTIGTGGGILVWDMERHAISRRLGERLPIQSGVQAVGQHVMVHSRQPTLLRGFELHFDLPSLLAWTRANRYMAPLTCFDRRRFGTLRQCGADGRPIAAPDLTRLGGPTSVADPPPVTSRVTIGPSSADLLRTGLCRPAAPEKVAPLAALQIHEEAVAGIAASAGSRVIATFPKLNTNADGYRRDETVAVMDAASGALVARFSGHQGDLVGLALSSDGGRLVSAGRDKRLVAWDTASGKSAWWHEEPDGVVGGVSLDASGRQVIYGVGGLVGRLAILDANNWQVVGLLGPEGPPIQKLVVSPGPGPARAVTVGSDNVFRVWDLGAGKVAATFGDKLVGHSSAVTSLRIDPSGARLLTASTDGTVILWDLAAGRLVRRFAGHEDRVSSAIFDTDGRRVISAGADEVLRVWDVESGHELHQFGPVMAGDLALTPDGHGVIAAADDGSLKVWPLDEGAAVTWGVDGSVPSVRQSTSPATAHQAGEARVGTNVGLLAPGTIDRWQIAGASNRALDVRVTAARPVTNTLDPVPRDDSKRVDLALVVRGTDGRVLAEADDTRGGQADPTIRNVELGADGLATVDVAASAPRAADEYSLTLATVPLVVSSRTIGVPARGAMLPGRDRLGLLALALTPDGRRAIAAGGASSLVRPPPTALPIRVWNLADGGLEAEMNLDPQVHESTISFLEALPDGQTVLAGSRDGRLVLWDLATRRERRRLAGHRGAVYALSVSPDGQLAVSAGRDRQLFVWDLATGTARRRFDSLREFRALTFTPSGRELVGVANSGEVLRWAFETDDAPRWVGFAAVGTRSLVLDATGEQLFAGSDNGSLTAYDVATMTPRWTVQHPFGIWALAIDPRGRYLATGEWDGTASLLRVADGGELGRMLGHLEAIRDLDFTPDGKGLVTASQDGSLRVWDVAGVVDSGN